MDGAQDQFKKYISPVIASVCFIFAAISCLYASSGLLPINTNDGSNFFLQALYAGQGLLPYRDYGFVYPPGIALFFGYLLHVTDGATFLRLIWLLSFALLGLNAFLTTKLKGSNQIIAGGILALVSLQPPLLLFRSHGTEPFTVLLLVTLVLLSLHHNQSPNTSSTRLAFLGFCGFVITLIRWDRAIAFGLVEMAAAAFLFVLTWCGLFETRQKTTAFQQAQRIGIAAASILIGAGMAIAFIALYALGTNSWVETWQFIFVLPTHMMPYRTLPFSSLNPLNAEGLWLTSILAVMVLAGVVLYRATQHKKTSPNFVTTISGGLVLLAAPVAMLPYAFGRSDVVHFMPSAGMAAMTFVITFVLWNDRKVQIISFAMLILLCIPLMGQLISFYAEEQSGPSILQHSFFDKNLAAATDDCTQLIPRGSHSLFVGRASYEHFIVSPLILYLARRDLVPATRYLGEDPSIQNACDYGRIIADELRHAPRPMVAFLSVSPQWREPNATEAMHSCGQIEKILTQTPSSLLGSCEIGGETLQAVLY